MEPRSALTVFTPLWLTLAMAAVPTVADEPAPRPAAPLLRLVPPEAAVVLSVDGLRDQAIAFGKSELADDLLQLPTVRAWLDSEKYRQFQQSRAMIETILGARLTELRDDLLGDAVVLALRLPSGPGDEPRGLALLRARNQVLLERVIGVINASQEESGELSRVADRRRLGTTYHVREFPAAVARPPEWYVAYPDGTLAMSNSESLIHAVIDRKAGVSTDPGLGDLPRFRSVERRLPERALVRLFVDPRKIERLIKDGPPSSKPAEARVKAMIERFLGAVDYAGLAFVRGDRTLAVHAVETLDPGKLDPWLLHWSRDARPIDRALERIPAGALAVASARVDAEALHGALAMIMADEDEPRLINMETVLTGLMLGQDLRTRILPRLGPGVFGYLDAPTEIAQEPQLPGVPPRRPWAFPPVLVISLGDARNAREAPGTVTVAAAVDNALTTVLALTALDEKRFQARSRIIGRVAAGVRVVTLDTPFPFAFAVDRVGSRLILSTSVGSIARYLEGPPDPVASGRFERFRAEAFPDATTFLCVDLDAINGMAERYKDLLAQNIAARQDRPADDVKKDLDQFLTLARLFQAAFISSRIDPQATAVTHSAGLIVRDQAAK